MPEYKDFYRWFRVTRDFALPVDIAALAITALWSLILRHDSNMHARFGTHFYSQDLYIFCSDIISKKKRPMR